MRLVLDTDVVVAALRSDRGASRQLLLGALDRRYGLLLSVPLVLEHEAVLTRPEHLAASELSEGEVGEILDALVKVAIPVVMRFLWRPMTKDPADEMVLATAVNGSADRLVTLNVRHLGGAAREFGIRTLAPGDALRELKSNEKE